MYTYIRKLEGKPKIGAFRERISRLVKSDTKIRS